ncbi:MAG: hypothetical protein AB3N28_14965 [Kordiimonas sp.]
MPIATFGAVVVAGFLAACSSTDTVRVAQSDAGANTDIFVAKEVNNGDWSKAEAALMNTDVAPEDQVFAKLNLAFVYSSTGRRDQAVAIYTEILDGKDNPYALTVSGQPRRVKTIAQAGLDRIQEQ